ncbi:hypothetical protein [Paludibaculum fermentans]|uniref:hypothetical protein n=1 Tax=Paludibaculum fermentans TaxID=1473598 RepID=UPI003EBAAB61
MLRLESSRPLATAAEILEAEYGWTINYEDPQDYCPQETTGATGAAVTKVVNQPRPLIPKPVRLEVRFPLAPHPPTNMEKRAILSRVVEAARREAGRNFTLMEADGSVDLIPSGYLDANCRFIARRSLMDTRVALEPGPRSFARILQEFVAALSKATGRPIGLGAGPTNFLNQTQLPMASLGGPARSVLRRLIDASKRKLAWQLLVDPGTGMAMLNLHFVETAQK